MDSYNQTLRYNATHVLVVGNKSFFIARARKRVKCRPGGERVGFNFNCLYNRIGSYLVTGAWTLIGLHSSLVEITKVGYG